MSVRGDVACDQVTAGRGERNSHVDIDLAAASMPFRPAVIVDRWHDALVARGALTSAALRCGALIA